MKKIASALKTIFTEVLDQLWTLVALAVGWLVLEGSAKTMTANIVIVTLIIWVATSKIRNSNK
jgi:hypothetical protein